MPDHLETPQSPEKKLENRTPETVNTSEISAKVEAEVVHVETSGGATEILAGMEGNEIQEKERKSVSENTSEGTVKTSSTSTSQKSQTQTTVISPPQPPATEKVMRRKVKTALVHEIKLQKKEVKKLKKNPTKNAFLLAEAFRVLKHLKALLAKISSCTVDFLKKLFKKTEKNESLSDVEQ